MSSFGDKLNEIELFDYVVNELEDIEDILAIRYLKTDRTYKVFSVRDDVLYDMSLSEGYQEPVFTPAEIQHRPSALDPEFFIRPEFHPATGDDPEDIPEYPDERMAGLYTISARDLLDTSLYDMWKNENLVGDMITECVADTGVVVVTTGRRLIWCRYIWDIFKNLRDVTITEDCIIDKDARISESLHNAILNVCYGRIIERYDEERGSDRGEFTAAVAEMIGQTYTDVTKYLSEFALGISFREIMDVFNYPPIKQAYLKLKPTQKSIDAFKDYVLQVIKTDPDFPKGFIRDGFLSGLISKEQAMQAFFIVGYRTELNSKIYKDPIMVPYSKGLRSEEDITKEKQNATKSPTYNKDEMGDSQYFNRLMQLVGSYVRTLDMRDCGTQVHYDWLVEPGTIDNLLGMYYLTKEEYDAGSRDYKYITKVDKHLVGTTIKARLIFGCNHPEPGTVCEKCYGRISRSFPKGSSPGWISGGYIGGTISQLTLKVKHEDGIGAMDSVEIKPELEGFLTTSSDPYSYRLDKRLKGARVYMVMSHTEAPYIPNIPYTVNLNDVSPVAVSSFDIVRLHVVWEGTDVVETADLPVSMGMRKAYLTPEMLAHISVMGFSMNEFNEYVVDLTDWNHDNLFVSVPNRHNSIVAFKNEVKSLITGSAKTSESDKLRDAKSTSMNNFGGTVETIKEVTSLIATKITINFSHVAAVCYVMAARDPNNFNYNLPKNGESYEFCTLKDIIGHRSLCGLMVFQQAEDMFERPYTYVVDQRHSHAADPFFLRFLQDEGID